MPSQVEGDVVRAFLALLIGAVCILIVAGIGYLGSFLPTWLGVYAVCCAGLLWFSWIAYDALGDED